MRKINLREDCFPDGTLAVYASDEALTAGVVAISPYDGSNYDELAVNALTRLLKYMKEREGKTDDDDPGRPDDPLR